MADLQIISKYYLTGDNQAVAELYSCLKDRLLLIAYNYSRDKEISRDIVQDIFEKMIRLHVEKRIEYFGSSGSNIEAYLSVAIKNKCKDLYKVKSNRENIIHSIRHLFTNKAENEYGTVPQELITTGFSGQIAKEIKNWNAESLHWPHRAIFCRHLA